jgi:hypothetical protein
MAIQKNFLDDEENQNQGQATSLEGTALGGGPTPATSAQPAKPQGTGWNNLQTYLTANQGQGGNVANAITQDTQKRVDAADSNAKLWEDEAKKRVDQNTRTDDKGYGQQIQSGDPTKIDQNAFGAWKNLSNYWGAANAQADSGYGSVYNQTQQAKKDVAGVQNYDTQKALAQQTFGKNGRYTQGMGTLDTFIMRGDQSGKDALQGFQDKNKSFGQTFDSAVGNINSYAQGAEQRGQSAYDNLMGMLGQRRQSIQDTAQQNLGKVYGDARSAAEQQVRDAYVKAGRDPNIGFGTGGTISRASDMSWVDGLGDPELAALNQLSNLDDDANTNAITKQNRPLATIDWDRVNQNIAAYQGVGRPTTPGTQTTVGTLGDGTAVNATDVGGIREDVHGNRIDDGLSTQEWLDRILRGT